MTYEDINALWGQDSQINPADLGFAAIGIPSLHHKYFKLFSAERINLRDVENQVAELKLIKTDYYLGNLDRETLKEHGWHQWEKKTLKTELPLYLSADQDMIKIQMKMAMAYERVDYLESILKQINGMQWVIKAAIDYARFKAGSM